MNDLNKDLSNKFLNYLDNKQFERLQFEAEMLGNIEDQHPLIIFYYASSIYLKETSKQKELLYSSSLFEKVYFTLGTSPRTHALVLTLANNEHSLWTGTNNSHHRYKMLWVYFNS